MMMHDIQMLNVVEKPKRKNVEAEKNLEQAKLNFMAYLENQVHKTSVDPKLLYLNICEIFKMNELPKGFL